MTMLRLATYQTVRLLRAPCRARASPGGALTCLQDPKWRERVVSCPPGVRASSSDGWLGGIAQSAPVHLCEDALVSAQQLSTCSWWLSIAMTTLSVRTLVTLPLAAYQMVIISKVENLQSEISEVAHRLRCQITLMATQRGWNERQCRFQFRRSLRSAVSELYVRENCHPVKSSVLVWVQIPLWVSLSLALRNLCLETSAQHAALSAGGALWFTDLTAPDSTWIIPICLGLTNLLLVEIFSLHRVSSSRFQRFLLNAVRGFSVLMVPVAATVPSGVAVYWLSSSLVGLTHNLLLRSPALHKLLRLKTISSASPYRDLLDAFARKFWK